MTGESGRGPVAPPPIADVIDLVPDHAGIVVADLEAVLAGFAPLLGQPTERTRIPEVGLESATFHVPGLALEILRFGSPQGEDARAGLDPQVFQASRGIQHLAFRVPSLDRALALLEERGGAVLQGFPRRGIYGEIAFFRLPGSELLWEFVQR